MQRAVLYLSYLMLSLFYLLVIVVAAFEAMVFKFLPLHDDNTGLKVYLVYLALCAFLLHKLAKEWLPDNMYHVVMTMGILFSLLPVLYIGTVLGWGS